METGNVREMSGKSKSVRENRESQGKALNVGEKTKIAQDLKKTFSNVLENFGRYGNGHVKNLRGEHFFMEKGP